MANASSVNYSCTDSSCLNPLVGRDFLTVRKVVFLEMGPGGRTVRSRVSGWLCPICLVKDADWKREKFLTPLLDKVEVLRG